MDCSNILIDLFIGIVAGIISGLLVSIIMYYFIEHRLKKREEYKSKLLLSFLFFESLETKMSGFCFEKINNRLVEYRNLYENDIELKKAFNNVDVSLCAVIHTNKNGGSASYDFNGEDYFNFKNILERRIKR